jgi:lipoprotein-anchoring transpeptidase ErfK/SrfK
VAWSVQEVPSDGTRADSVIVRWEMLRLIVQWRYSYEQLAFEEYGPAVEAEPRETVDFLGQTVRSDVLIEDGRVKGVEYVAPGNQTEVGSLVFAISLRSIAADECLRRFDLECGYATIDIAPHLQAMALQVLSSFELIGEPAPLPDIHPGWTKYSRADHGFAFRYPQGWVLREGENFVSLRQGTVRLTLGYRGVSDDPNLCCRAEQDAGAILPAGTLTVLSQEVSRALVVDEGKVKAVIYNDGQRVTAGSTEFLFLLDDFAADYGSVDLPSSLQAEADQIFASLETVEQVITPGPVGPAPTRIPPTPAPATPTPLFPLVVAGQDGADVRGGPGPSYARLGRLSPGGQASLLGRHEEWWQIEYDGGLAWVAAADVTAQDSQGVPEVDPPAAPQQPVVVAGEDGVNVRSGPGTDYARLGSLSPSEQAVVTGRYEEWWQIEYAGQHGWVSDLFVAAYDTGAIQVVQPPPTPVPSSPAVIPTPAPATQLNESRWIDVSLTDQRVTAYESQTAVYTTLASTGLPNTPTPPGQYRIWIKLRHDDMSGPGYYLEDVPFVMYFYQGYGFHGVWWHANFGHPMSHGCVNLPADAAEWLFDWAEVGTLVNVHD